MKTTALEARAGKLLLEQGKTIALAESCTGGLATSLLTDVAGSSAYVLGSVVSYTNEIKAKVLGVDTEILATEGAVSPQVAQQMAQGVRSLMGSDYGLGITGNAGPGPSEGKPVGLVYIAIAYKDQVQVEELHFQGSRTENKLRIAQRALSMLIDILLLPKGNRCEEFMEEQK